MTRGRIRRPWPCCPAPGPLGQTLRHLAAGRGWSAVKPSTRPTCASVRATWWRGRSPRLLGKLPMGDGARSDSAAGQFFFANRRHTKGIGCTMGQFRTSRPFRAFGAHQACRYHQERTVMSMSNGSAMSTGVAPLLRLVIARSGRIAATDLTAAVRDRSCRGSPRRRSALLQRPLPARPVYERDGLIFWVLLEGGVRGRRQVRATGPRTGLQKILAIGEGFGVLVAYSGTWAEFPVLDESCEREGPAQLPGGRMNSPAPWSVGVAREGVV